MQQLQKRNYKMTQMKQNQKTNLINTNQKTIAGLLEQMKGEISRCLPKHLTPERMTRIALTELRKTPKLQECDPMSFIAAIMQAAQLGLEPGILGSCYLIPFYNNRLGKHECTFMPGYRGFLDLARRSGQIISLVSRSVFENDEFTYEFGLKENLIHKPALDDRGQLMAVYAVALLKDGGHQFEVMSVREVNVIRDASKSKDNGPWVTHYEEMAKKSVLRKLFKWLPCSVEIQRAVSLDEQQEHGIQNIKQAASEEFDINFIDDQEIHTRKVTKSEELMDKIKSATDNEKSDDFVDLETGECATAEQLQEIHNYMSVKVFSKKQLDEILEQFKVKILAELTRNQASEFIKILKQCNDK
jgi:recombination protein RecT